MRLGLAVLARALALALALSAVHGERLWGTRAGQITRLALGSCHRTEQAADSQAAFQALQAIDPDVFIWLGDIVYGDTRVAPFFFRPSPPDVLRAKYTALAISAPYRAFRAQRNVTVIGTYDDHDYNCNNCGREHDGKAVARDALWNFLDVPPGDMDTRQRDGAYSVHDYGEGAQRVRVILLDARSHREPRFSGDPAQRDVLGAAQWRWLEAQLAPADLSRMALTLVCSGVQLVSSDKPPPAEGWHWFPGARRRLFDLLARASAAASAAAPGSGAVLLASGDVHLGELSLARHCVDGLCAPLYDLTTSGMTHALSEGFLGAIAHALYSWRMLPGALRVGELVLVRNVASLEIDWAAQAIVLSHHAIPSGAVLASTRLALADLRARSNACECSGEVSAALLLITPMRLAASGAALFLTAALACRRRAARV